jgi:hypothetical protein
MKKKQEPKPKIFRTADGQKIIWAYCEYPVPVVEDQKDFGPEFWP